MDGSVEFKNVTFGYRKNLPILKNVSFKVAPGETVALVGPTGSGKSSCMSLVHRFYDVWEGEVLVGGHDVRDLTQDSLGDQVAMVLQEPFLFSGTVLENIRYHKTDASRDDVDPRRPGRRRARLHHGAAAAATTACSASAATTCQPRPAPAPELCPRPGRRREDPGARRGDRHRSTATPRCQIQKALVMLLEGRTGLVIAHRLATIRGADRIIVLQQGEVVEEGNHDQLMAKGGLYAKLYNMNYASFDDLPDDFMSTGGSSGGTTSAAGGRPRRLLDRRQPVGTPEGAPVARHAPPIAAAAAARNHLVAVDPAARDADRAPEVDLAIVEGLGVRDVARVEIGAAVRNLQQAAADHPACRRSRRAMAAPRSR